MKSPLRNFVETNLIMLGLLFYCCEDTQPDSSDGIDAGVVINEINYNSLDSFDPDDWVEIYNSSSESIDLGSWLLKDENDDHIFSVPSNTILLPDQYLVFCTDTIKFTALFPDVNPYYGDLGFGLGGGGDFVRLFDYNGLLVDIVEYDDIAPWDTLADGSGPTLELNHPSLDNTLGESWSASQGYGTPGAVNSAYNGYE
ncbi:MAG TPA: lamin tail domain-containing protein [Candidatus Marinimicrobia bacterium]|jgi:hypothetical protein|nr:lamin tail domain-containing protein [Candidatus Neomarinimicrobiota bacterium]